MSTSRIFVTKRRVVYLCHICSSCNYPVLSYVTITSEGQKTYSFMQEHATDLADRLAEEGIQDEIVRIRERIVARGVLTSTGNRNSFRGVGRFCNSRLTGQNSPCPNCGAYESWMEGHKGKLSLNNTPKLSFPTLFTVFSEAEEWAISYIQTLINKAQCSQLSEVSIANARRDHVRLCISIEDLISQRDSLPEIAQKKALLKEQEIVVQNKKSLHFFDIRKKNSMNQTLKEIELRLRDLDKNITLQQFALNKEIKRRANLLREEQIKAYGCSGKHIVQQEGESIVFLVEPSSIDNAAFSYYVSELLSELQGNSTYEESKFCRKCGKSLSNSVSFCRVCGAKIETN
ncbi:MAG: zinc ribbon domain-containing protein [Oscillospiraceae bacterium]|nr:zinc ribbon domain-containing protein [Oscillospiraceae bacterium]